MNNVSDLQLLLIGCTPSIFQEWLEPLAEEGKALTIVAAETADEITSCLRENKVDAVAVVFNKNHKNREFDLLEQVQKNEFLDNRPVLIVTDTPDQETRLAKEKIENVFLMSKSTPALSGLLHSWLAECRTRLLLRQQNEELSADFDDLINTVPCGVVVFADMGCGKIRTHCYNQKYLDIIGYTDEEYQTRFRDDPLQLICDEDRCDIECQICGILQGCRPVRLSYRIRHQNGDLRWIKLFGSQYKTENGHRLYRCFYFDDTEERRRAEHYAKQGRELQHSMEHDILTGIYNKVAFCRLTEEMLDRHPEESFVLLRFNVDKFKIINDLYSNECGDDIMKYLANYLREHYETIGTYGRLESDNFGACVPQSSVNYTELESHLRHSIIFNGMRVPFSFTIGAYEVKDRSISVHTMCDKANIALQVAKEHFKNRCVKYTEDMWEKILEDQRITGEVSAAMDAGEFDVYFQPIYSVEEDRYATAEALVRWIDPKTGRARPNTFIPLLERNGFILTLDKFVWERVCSRLRSWIDQGLEVLPISINVSQLHISDPNFVSGLVALTNKYNIDRKLLHLEITESAYVENSNIIQSVLEQLQANGFSILMDDFGSEYSSLNMLKELNVDVLKIDMRFIRDMERIPKAKTILTAVIRMAKWLKLATVGEGVETQEQADFLRSIGCGYIQGFYFARPMPETDFEGLLREGKVQMKQTSRPLDFHNFDVSEMVYSDPRFEVLWECVNVGLGIVEMHDDKLFIVKANEIYYQFFPDQLALRGEQYDILSLLRESSRTHIVNKCREAVKTDRLVTVNYRPKSDASPKWLEIGIKFVAKTNNYMQFCFTCRDISGQRNDEEARLSHQFANAVSGLFCAVYEIDVKHGELNILVNNRNMPSPPPGYSLEQLVEWYAVKVHEDDREAFLEFYDMANQVAKFTSSDTVLRTEYRFETQQGGYCTLGITMSRLDENRYAACVTDLDEQRNAERDMMQQERRIIRRNEDELYRLAAESGQELLFEYNLVNDRLKYFERQADGTVQRVVRTQFINEFLNREDCPMTPENKVLFREEVALASKEVIDRTVCCAIDFYGVSRMATVHYHSVADDDGKVYHLVGCLKYLPDDF